MMRNAVSISSLVLLFLSCAATLESHSGPPFPILSNRIVGAYDISIWSDPDSTDDGTASGKFWVVLESAGRRATIPKDTYAVISIRPLDRPGPVLTARAHSVNGDASHQYVALLMDHEGPYAVHVTVDGASGRAEVDSHVDASYDLRPAPFLLAVFLLPFILIGLLWTQVLRRRRRALARTGSPSENATPRGGGIPMRSRRCTR